MGKVYLFIRYASLLPLWNLKLDASNSWVLSLKKKPPHCPMRWLFAGYGWNVIFFPKSCGRSRKSFVHLAHQQTLDEQQSLTRCCSRHWGREERTGWTEIPAFKGWLPWQGREGNKQMNRWMEKMETADGGEGISWYRWAGRPSLKRHMSLARSRRKKPQGQRLQVALASEGFERRPVWWRRWRREVDSRHLRWPYWRIYLGEQTIPSEMRRHLWVLNGRMSCSGLYCMIIAAVRGARVYHKEPQKGWGKEVKVTQTRVEEKMQMIFYIYEVKSSGLASELDSKGRKFSLFLLVLMFTA